LSCGIGRGDRESLEDVVTTGGHQRGWPDFGEGWPAVVLWRRPVSRHGRRSGASQSMGGGGGGLARPREAASGGGFLRRDSTAGGSRTAGGGPAAPAAQGWAKGG
jgi:hypothetical protein